MARPEDRVALIEWLDREGHVQRSLDVTAWPLSLGRALDNTVVLDDPFVAAHHATLGLADDGSLQLQALPSHNGVVLDGQALGGTPGPALAPLVTRAGGNLLQLGQTRLRMRLQGADAALAPERPLPALAGGSQRRQVLYALALGLLALASHAVNLDPGADYTAWLPLVLGLPVAVVAWSGLWALLSKLFQHRFDFTGHLRIALPWLLALQLQDMLWPALTAALALPGAWMAGGLLANLLLALLLHAHLRHMLPAHGRAVSAAAVAMVLAGAGLAAAITWRSHDSLVATPYMSTLPLPALRLTGTAPSAMLVQEMAPLADALAERVARARQHEAQGQDGGEDDSTE